MRTTIQTITGLAACYLFLVVANLPSAFLEA